MHQNDWDSWDDELLIREVDYADILDNLFWSSNEEIFFLRLMVSGLNLGNYSLVMVQIIDTVKFQEFLIEKNFYYETFHVIDIQIRDCNLQVIFVPLIF